MSKRLGKLAKRYARAFLSSIDAQKTTGTDELTEAQRTAEGLIAFAEIWEQDQELANVVLNPMFDASERLSAMQKVAEAMKLPPLTIRFLTVLFERDRIAALPEIAEVFADLADEAADVVKVLITTAREVDETERHAIEHDLEKQIGGTPAFCWEVDANILGGMIVEYRGAMIDGSLAGRLEKLEKTLIG